MSRVFIVGAVIHLSVLSLFVYLRNKTPQFIRKSGADRSTPAPLQTQSFHPLPTHQHPIIPEFDKNLKNIVGQIYSSEQIQERYEDYVRRMNELYNSSNVQFMIWREHQQQEQENRQKISLALSSGTKETESNKQSALAKQKKNPRNAQIQSQSQPSPSTAFATAIQTKTNSSHPSPSRKKKKDS